MKCKFPLILYIFVLYQINRILIFLYYNLIIINARLSYIQNI